MKILFATPYLPYPPRSGGNIRTFNLIKLASKHHEVRLVSLVYPDEEQYLDELGQYCIVYPIPFKPRRYGRIRSLFSPDPHLTMRRYVSDSYMEQVKSTIDEYEPDLIQVESLLMAGNMEKIDIPMVFDAHNIESDIMYRTFSSGGISLRSVLSLIDYVKTLRYEKKAVKRFETCLAVSDNDATRIRQMGAKKVLTLPNCVDMEYYKPLPRKNSSPSVAFTGLMNWYPNTDAVITFCKSAIHLLKEKVPGIKFYAVGRNPEDVIKECGNDPDIVITGEVPDVRQYIADADACVVPLRIGGGTRLKILEYFSMQVPVISTSIGVEGIEVEDGVHILIEDDISRFGDRVEQLRKDPELAAALVANACELVRQKYSWEGYGPMLDEVYRELHHAGR